jgi:hypothetical protein
VFLAAFRLARVGARRERGEHYGGEPEVFPWAFEKNAVEESGIPATLIAASL